jgi:hypothetical protein
MYHPSFTGGLSRFDLHTNTDLFLRLSYVFMPCYHDLSRRDRLLDSGEIALSDFALPPSPLYQP